jgi:uroporphyrinogen decarboxylase
MSHLSSRERVRIALNHEEPDRVPVDFGGSRITGIAAVAYRKLIRKLGIEEDVRIYDVKQQLAWPSMEVANRLGGDVAFLTRLGPTTGMPFLEIDRWKPGVMTDGAPCLVPAAYSPVLQPGGDIEIWKDGVRFARRSPKSMYFDPCVAPLAGAETPGDIDSFCWPDPWSDHEEQWLKAQTKKMFEETDKSLFAALPMYICSFFEVGLMLFGYERFMENLLLKPELIEYWLDVKLDHDLNILDKLLSVVGPFIEVIQLNDDFGAQDSLQIPPAFYRSMFKPRQKKWVDFVKARTKAKVFIHCDGAVEEILADFIEIGIDILNPLQTSARNMDPEKIKRKYGKNLSFWGGGVDTQNTLPFGSIPQIRSEVRGRVELLAKGGGFVFGTIHNIQPDIPPEKIMAVFETAIQSGVYS